MPLKAKFIELKKAQEKFSNFTQEQVNAIFQSCSIAANKARIPLAKMAYEETKMGVLEDKVIKNHFACESIYNAYKHTKTVGVFEEDKSAGIKKIFEPVGVIAAIIPTTNPTSTVIFKALLALKTRNAIIFSPHPRAKRCSVEAAKIIYEAALKAGAPEHIISWINEPTIELSALSMQLSDLVLATGGPNMVSAAYSSGKPAVGVGPGNVPVLVDGSADIKMMVSSVLASKTFDNGLICSSEQSCLVVESAYKQAREEFMNRGGYILDKAQKDKLRKLMFPKGALNIEAIGQSAATIANMAGIEIPPQSNVRALIVELESVERSEPLAYEKLSPVLALVKVKDFKDGLNKVDHILKEEGYGHTSSLFIDEAESEKIAQFESSIKTGRILINTPSSHGAIGDLFNFKLPPSMTLGCGSWGRNSTAENVGVKHLLNIKTVATRRENMLWLKVPEKIYFKRGCLDMAIREVGTYYGKKRAFIVTDQYLHDNGFIAPLQRAFDELGIAHACFYNIKPDPTLSAVKEGLAFMNDFKPDAIVALGGGSPIDAAKTMWLLYEYPETKFEDMAMRFLDIYKRIYQFPKMGKKAIFVAIPTSAGTGSEATPFAVVTDDSIIKEKYPLADYELMPTMAIVDCNLTQNSPKGLTAASGIDALAHCLESYASIMASDFTDGMSLQGIKLVFDNLASAYHRSDREAREHMAHAATIAGIAFANAFLGIVHSLSHKLGASFGVTHGHANIILLPYVMRFNILKEGKITPFAQYKYPKALERYVHMAKHCGIEGKDDLEIFEKFLKKIDDLRSSVNLPRTIKELGVNEAEFLAKVEHMSEQAYDDQCTGANPRQPSIAEIKQMYLDAYYGK